MGSNRDEGTFFSRPGGRQRRAVFGARPSSVLTDLADAYLKLYPASSDDGSGHVAAGEFPRRNGLAHARPGRRLQSQSAEKAKRTCISSRTYRRSAPGQPSRGATHTAEIWRICSTILRQTATRGPTSIKQLAETMSSYWVNFAATGDPNGKGLPEWPAYKAKSAEQAMVLGDTVTAGSSIDPAMLGVLRSRIIAKLSSASVCRINLMSKSWMITCGRVRRFVDGLRCRSPGAKQRLREYRRMAGWHRLPVCGQHHGYRELGH